MSNIHSHTNSPYLAFAEQGDAMTALRGRLSAAVHSLFARLEHRRIMRRFERFSDHDLQDVGFQREWDGSIQPLNR